MASSKSPASAGSTPRAVQRRSPSSQVRQQQYLILYNLVSGFLWFAVLARVAFVFAIGGPAHVHEEVGNFARWTQTLALLEVAHSAFGK